LREYKPHPLNHLRFRALSCTLRGAGLALPLSKGERRRGRSGESKKRIR